MNFSTTTKRLILKTETEMAWHKILEFYEENKKHLEPVEPTRDIHFYTPTYQLQTLSIEHQLMKSKTYLRLWIYLKKNPQNMIGTICFSDIFHETAYLGYKMDYRFLKQGYCYEACKHGMDIIQSQYDVSKIKAYVLPSNLASIHLLEKLQFHRAHRDFKTSSIYGEEQSMLLYEYKKLENNGNQ